MSASTRLPLSEAPASASDRERHILNRLTGFLVAVLLSFALLFGLQTWKQTRDIQISELSTVMALGEKSLDKYFSLLEGSLHGLSDELAADEGDLERSRQAVVRFSRLHPDVLSISLIRPDGQITISSASGPGAPLPSVKAITAFETSIDAMRKGIDFLIGRPVLGVTTKRWVLPLRQAVRDRSGRLQAMLVATMPIDLLQTFWKDAPIIRHASIGLIDDDGYLMTRYPVSAEIELADVYGTPRTGTLRKHLVQQKFPLSGHVEGFNVIGGANYLNVYQRLAHYPATLFVAMPSTGAKAMWWSAVRAVYGLLFLLFSGVALVYVAARRQQSRDITQRHKSQKEIHDLAFYDALTGLPNRRLLMDRLGQSLAHSKRSSARGALLYLDLDHFKNINDARGHAVGDAVLKHVAHTLTALLRAEDTVSRIGGDEFVVLISGSNCDEASNARAAGILTEKILAQLAKPIDIDDQPYAIYASIGVSLFSSDKPSVDDVMREADTAMYKAKSSGRARAVFFEAGMQAEVQSRVAMEIDLAGAIAAEQFTMVFQPQVGVGGKIVGGELLVRWHHPSRGAVPPVQFIPLAEQTGLIIPLGNWILHQGCEIHLQLKAAGHRFPLSINVSPRQFRQSDFVQQVTAALAKTGADASMLIFEVTEGLLIEDVEGTIARMHELASLGIRFSIDDFGTGYSSLAYLKRLPLYELKIDKSFVDDTPSDGNDTAIVQMILSMAKHLGLRVVAEGVETQDQADFLFQCNCDCLQGYLFARPMCVADWLEKNRGAVLEYS